MNKFLTSEGRQKIEREIKDLKKQKPPIAERICSSKELGDLSENSEYTTAKEELAQVQSRIRELENLLRTANIVKSHEQNGCVNIGSKIIIEIKGQEKEYKLVGTEESNPSQGFISYESPLGEAVLGKKQGEEIEINTPQGKIKAKINKIE